MARRSKRRTDIMVFGKKIPIVYLDLKGEGDGVDVISGAYGRGKIALEKSEIGIQAQHTLLHESIHAVFDRVGITQSLSTELEEIIAENIASFLVENFDIRDK